MSVPAGVLADETTDPGLVLDQLVVETRITDGIGVTTVTGTFTNPTNEAMEERVAFPFPESAVLTGFTLTTWNQTFTGIVYERNQARVDYDESAARGEHAVLLESAGHGSLSLRLNVPAAETVVLEMGYAQVVPLVAGVHEFGFPLDAIMDGKAAGRLVYDLQVRATEPWDDIETTGVAFEQIFAEPGFLHVRHDSTNATAAAPMTVRITGDPDGFMSTLAVSEFGQEEAFALFQVLAPLTGVGPISLDVVFLIDVSGSMQTEKMEQAKTALHTILDQLRSDDRFALAKFSTEVSWHKKSLDEPTNANMGTAHDWVDTLESGGSTNIGDSLRQAFEVLGDDGHESGDTTNLPVVVLITDGRPTEGMKNQGEIVEAVDEWNRFDARVHTVGIGMDHDNAFLGELAERNKGHYRPLDRSADASEGLAGFYEEIGTPVLRDVEVRFPTLDASEVHPKPLKDVYAGSHIVAAARVDTTDLPNLVPVIVTGETASGSFEETTFIEADDVRVLPEAERLWARQKAATLERQIDLSLADTATAGLDLLQHGLEHQVATTVTSWLIVDDERLQEVSDEIEKILNGEDGEEQTVAGEKPTARIDGFAGADEAGHTARRQGLPAGDATDDRARQEQDPEEEPSPGPGALGLLGIVAIALVLFARTRRGR